MVNNKLWVNGHITQSVANQKVGTAASELAQGTQKLGDLTGHQGTSKWGHEEGAEQVRNGFATVLEEIAFEVSNIQKAFEEYKKSISVVVTHTETVDDAALSDFNKVATQLMKPPTVTTNHPPLEAPGGTATTGGRGSFGAGQIVPTPQTPPGR